MNGLDATIALNAEIEATLTDALQPLITQRQKLVLAIKGMQAEVDELSEELTGALVRGGLTELTTDTHTLKYIVSERHTLDKTRLVELGVGTDVIAKATKTSTFGRIDIREVKGTASK